MADVVLKNRLGVDTAYAGVQTVKLNADNATSPTKSGYSYFTAPTFSRYFFNPSLTPIDVEGFAPGATIAFSYDNPDGNYIFKVETVSAQGGKAVKVTYRNGNIAEAIFVYSSVDITGENAESAFGISAADGVSSTDLSITADSWWRYNVDNVLSDVPRSQKVVAGIVQYLYVVNDLSVLHEEVASKILTKYGAIGEFTVTQNGTTNLYGGVSPYSQVAVNVEVPTKTEEELVVPLSMGDGDQVVEPEQGKVLARVTVTKPNTLLPENVKKDVDIGGVVGTLDSSAALQDKSVKINANGTQTVLPDANYDALSSVSVDTFVAPPFGEYRLLSPTIKPLKPDNEETDIIVGYNGARDSAAIVAAAWNSDNIPYIVITKFFTSEMISTFRLSNIEQYDAVFYAFQETEIELNGVGATLPVGWSYALNNVVSPIDASVTTVSIPLKISLNSPVVEENKDYYKNLYIPSTEIDGSITLSFANGNQVVVANLGEAYHLLTLLKPDTLLPENIKKGVNIAGIVGTLEPGSAAQYYSITQTILDNGNCRLDIADAVGGEYDVIQTVIGSGNCLLTITTV